MEAIKKVLQSYEEETVAFGLERDVIRVVGPEAGKYLQGQLTQDIFTMKKNESLWSFLLNPDGKVNSWLRVTMVNEDHFLLDVDQAFGQGVLSRLLRFKIRTDCELSLEKWDWVSVWGRNAYSFSEKSGSQQISTQSPWSLCDSFDLIGPNARLIFQEFPESQRSYDFMRILNCVPRMGSELHEKIIPAETGLIELSVSFTKGCYTGQELVARIDSRGNNTPRNLLLIASNHNFSIGNQVEVNEKLAGAITSVAKEGDLTVGLAYLSRNVTSPTVGKIEGKEVFVNSPKDFLG
ncbi:MAG: hypothetical protein CL431_09905 [Acidimicrobiaceae bacterium]|jgi:folate-binding protein YgfZ|nr:hypothetical protein [Acidimicrobiaceae bacterium]|tara:strand:- start:89900 stop:90778 length:879 start_codon:yes stop_codon:yes gene_type:complete